MAGEKHYLGSIIRYGNENLEAWKELFENLAERGVRRVLMVITDNFSGIEKVIKGYYPLAMTQFCLVHLIRNARYRLSKEEWKIFREKIEMIEKVNRYEEADRLMEEIIEMVEKKHRSFAKEIRKDKERYIAFVKFPKEIRSRIKSNNASENFHIHNYQQVPVIIYKVCMEVEILLSSAPFCLLSSPAHSHLFPPNYSLFLDLKKIAVIFNASPLVK